MTMADDYRGKRMIHETEIGAGAFKARCLKLPDNVALNRESLVITKRGKAVARLVPMPDTPKLFGAMSGSVMKVGDIVSPLKNEWKVTR